MSPWPGKCFAQAATPSRCSPSAKATAWRATSSGSREKLRSPITGFAGLVSTSATGRIEVHAQVRELAAERAGQRLGIGRRAVLAQAPHRRPLGPGRAQALHAAALLVDGHRERRARRRALVQLGDQRARLLRGANVAREEHDAPHAPGADQRGEILRQRRPGESGEQELPGCDCEATAHTLPELAGASRRGRPGRARIGVRLQLEAPMSERSNPLAGTGALGTTQKLADGVAQFHGFCNVGMVWGGGEVLVVDTSQQRLGARAVAGLREQTPDRSRSWSTRTATSITWAGRRRSWPMRSSAATRAPPSGRIGICPHASRATPRPGAGTTR